MFENKCIAFIGPGVMAEAMIAGLVRAERGEAGGDGRCRADSRAPGVPQEKYASTCAAITPRLPAMRMSSCSR